MDIASLECEYRKSTLTPSAVVEQIYAEIAQTGERPVWITLVPKEESLARARMLEEDEAAHVLPLYGIPFAVKDNFDVEGLPTTAACPAFSYVATKTATVVRKLLDAGAILVGKTNMDQFATGLAGTRTPYGVCSSVFNPEYALANTTPPKPGLVYAPGFGGKGIEIEVWAMPEDTVGSFLNAIPPPLALGTIRLSDGSMVKGFLCEPAGIEGAQEITHFGGWRGFVLQMA